MNGVPLVNLLKDGLKDGRVEAQEYALRSLLSISDTAAKEAIVEAGCIKPLIASLSGGKISAIAQEHAAAVLSGLAPIGENSRAIKDAKGIDPLVLLLSTGTSEAKAHAAAALAQLARRADAANEIAEAGAVSAFVQWLADPTLGPPEVAASALSEISLDNTDTQAQIAEEGAILPLVLMTGAWSRQATPTAPGSPTSPQPLAQTEQTPQTPKGSTTPKGATTPKGSNAPAPAGKSGSRRTSKEAPAATPAGAAPSPAPQLAAAPSTASLLGGACERAFRLRPSRSALHRRGLCTWCRACGRTIGRRTGNGSRHGSSARTSCGDGLRSFSRSGCG